jgi:serine/threonine protein kinase
MMIGQQYKILAELGAGGMGIVYQGVDVMLEREVAIKKLRSEFSRSAEVAERFRREAKIQARLNHPNLAHLYSFFKEGEAFYIVMEFVNGIPLSRLYPMSWQRALPIFRQILDSLEYAHSLGVLHRDIKPDNIMVSPRGDVKVMDFGIAHVLGSVRQTREKSIVGTLEYVCPEQIAGKAISPRSDIYSLGILLFELISGGLPFESQAEFELLRHHLETPPPRLSTRVPDIPEFLDEAVERAMSKSPEDRFASCRAMAEVLRQGAPEVFSAPPESFSPQNRGDEVGRCASRVEALLAGGEMDLARSVLERALADYPDAQQLSSLEVRVRSEGQRRAGDALQDEKTTYLREVLGKLSELEAAGAASAARELAQKALDRYPQIPALRIAMAHLKATHQG